MKQRFVHRHGLADLLRDRRGIVSVVMAASLPFMMGLVALAIDMGYAYWTRNMLQVTAEAAALAATGQVGLATSCTDPASPCYVAKQYAAKNMPTADYGSVLADADVVLGTWSNSTKTFTAGGSSPNAVQATTRKALGLFFAPVVGISSIDLSATAVATFETTPTGSPQAPSDVIIVQEIAASFANAKQQAQDAALNMLDCLKNNAAAGSYLGLTGFDGQGVVQVPLTLLSNPNLGNNSNLGSNNNYKCNGDVNTPPCSVIDQSKGISCAAAQFSVGSTSNCSNWSNSMTKLPALTSTQIAAGYRRSVVIVSDSYPTCTGAGCSVSALKTAAQTAADTAYNNSIDVSTIYLGTDSGVASWLASLARGHGVALQTSNKSQLSNQSYNTCAQIQRRLVW